MSQIAFTHAAVRLMHETDAQAPLETLEMIKETTMPRGKSTRSVLLRDSLFLFIKGYDMSPAEQATNTALPLTKACLAGQFDEVAKTLKSAGFTRTDNRAMQSVLTRMAVGIYLPDLIRIVKQREAFKIQPPKRVTWG